MTTMNNIRYFSIFGSMALLSGLLLYRLENTDLGEAERFVEEKAVLDEYFNPPAAYLYSELCDYLFDGVALPGELAPRKFKYPLTETGAIRETRRLLKNNGYSGSIRIDFECISRLGVKSA